MSIALLCIALLALLVIGLGFAVSLTRAKTHTIHGCPDDPEHPMYKIVRAHGNSTEYVPILALLIYVLSTALQPDWVIACMLLATFSRYLFVVGLVFPSTMAKPNPMRFLGALGTYLAGLGLCVAVLQQALAG